MAGLTDLTNHEALTILASRLRSAIVPPHAAPLVKPVVYPDRCIVVADKAQIVVGADRAQSALHYLSHGLTSHQQLLGITKAFDFYLASDYKSLRVEIANSDPDPIAGDLQFSRFTLRDDNHPNKKVYETSK